MTVDLLRRDCLSAPEVWFFLHDLLRPPDERQWAWLSGSEVMETYHRLGEVMGLEPFSVRDWPRNARRYETEFIAAFDVGAPTPLVPLVESHYNKRDPVPRILHENILFYKAFGLSLREASLESADHLRFQLEFIGYLHHLEQAEVVRENASERCVQISQARMDFVSRHLKSWVPEAARKAADGPFPWVKNHLELVLSLVEAASEV